MNFLLESILWGIPQAFTRSLERRALPDTGLYEGTTRGLITCDFQPYQNLAAFQRVTILRLYRRSNAGHSAGGSKFFADDAAECFLQGFTGALDVLAQGFVD
jgi:hypothetical protein